MYYIVYAITRSQAYHVKMTRKTYLLHTLNTHCERIPIQKELCQLGIIIWLSGKVLNFPQADLFNGMLAPFTQDKMRTFTGWANVFTQI